MADIKLGERIFEGVNSVKLNTTDGETVTFEAGCSTDLTPIVEAVESLGGTVETADVDGLAAAVADIADIIDPWELLPSEGTDIIGDYTSESTRNTTSLYDQAVYVRLKKNHRSKLLVSKLCENGGIDLTEFRNGDQFAYNANGVSSVLLNHKFNRCILPETYPVNNGFSPLGLSSLYPPAALYLSKKMQEGSKTKGPDSSWVAYNNSSFTEQIVKCPKDTEIPYYFNKFTALTVESMVGLFENMIDRSGETTVATITLGSTNLAKLTEEQKNIAYAKGWTLA